jgi:aldose 1-epimerase
VLEVESTQPALGLYTGNHLKGTVGKQGKAYEDWGAVCLETQHEPDAVNHPNFTSTIFTPEKPYHEVCVWRFLAE